MPIEIITNDDLEQFRIKLLEDIKQLFGSRQDDTKKWLRNMDVGKILGVSPNTLQNMRISGHLKSTKINGIHYYKAEDVYKMLEGKK
ncbi:MAG TPA: helix-turn-helix domain-containing protein [Mucilaginibacter sp.]|jgi:hypothetical protein